MANLLSSYDKHQYAYRPHGSTTAALLSIQEHVTQFLDEDNCWGVYMTALDLSKAFDKVPHRDLLKHLKGKVSGYFYNWLKDYLTNRLFRIRQSGHYSSLFTVSSGVPQGSVIAPYLFASYVSPLSPAFGNCKYVKYADDITIIQPLMFPITDYDDRELLHSKKWLESKGLVLNEKKTKTILFAKKKLNSIAQTLPCDHKLTVLAVQWSCDFKWNSHVERVIRTCSSRLFLLRKLKPLVRKKDLITVYQATIVSVLLYAAPLFVGLHKTLNACLEKIRKRAHRIICDSSCDCELFPQIESLRLQRSVSLLRQAELNADHPLHELVPSRLPRSQALSMPLVLTYRRMDSFLPRTCCIMNASAIRTAYDL